MQLLQLELKNWCQHRHRVCNFARGLIAVMGRIGSGKSNILGAVRWCLTGDNPNNGVKMDNVSQLAPEDEAAFARLDFEHRGHLLSVTRFLRPEKEQSVLLLDGVEVARGDKAVTAYVERILGIDSKFIGRFILVAQNELFSFIEDERSEVDKFFQRLFDTAKAEKIADVIGKQIAKTQVPEILISSGTLAQQLKDLETEKETLYAQLSPLPTIEQFLTAQTAHQKALQDWDAKTKALEEKKQLATKLATLTAQHQALDAQCRQYDADLAALTDAASGNESAQAAARVALGHWDSYKKIASAKKDLADKLSAIQQQRNATPAPQPVNKAQLELAISAEHTIAHDLKRAQTFVSVFTQHGVAECPTCHTPTKDLQSYLTGQQQALVDLKTRHADAKKLVADLAQQQATYDSWATADRELAARETQLLETETKLVSVSPPELTESELKQIVSDYESFQDAKNDLLPLANTAKTQRAELAGAIQATEDRLAAVTQSIADSVTTEADVHLIQLSLNKMRERCAQRQKLEQDYAQLEFANQKLTEELSVTTVAENKAETLRAWLTTADRAKTALKAAPRIVAGRNLAKLETAINELLEIFGVDFLVAAEQNGTPAFVAEFFDGRKQPARRLSYGQKTVLALAFRVAVNSMFAEEIGLLILDEPTAYLDQQRIKALAPVLSKLRELSTARGLQCVIVTHEMGLAHLFESSIELDVAK